MGSEMCIRDRCPIMSMNSKGEKYITVAHFQESHGYSYFTHLRNDFREKHTRSGLVQGTNQIDETMKYMKNVRNFAKISIIVLKLCYDKYFA